LTVRQWCDRQRVAESAFYFWRRTIAQRDRDASRIGAPAFVPVTLAMPACPELVERAREHPIIIRLRGGRVMRLPVGMDARRVAELVHAIEGEPALSEPVVSLSNRSNESKGVAS
jgi:hypothetical protein